MRLSHCVFPVVLLLALGCLPDDPKESPDDPSASDGADPPDGEPPGGGSADGTDSGDGGDDEGGDDGGAGEGGGTDDGGDGGGTDDGDDGGEGGEGDDGDDVNPVIDLSPMDHDLGTVYFGCEVSHTLTVANVGSGDLIVSDVELNTASTELALQSFDGSHGSLPWAIAAGDSLELAVDYEPQDAFADTAYIQVESNDPYTPSALAVLEAEGGPYAEHVDVFEQPIPPTDAFALTQTPVPSTLHVEVDGVQATVGWSYDSTSNSILLDASFVPESGSVIEVEYALVGPC